MGVEDSPEKDSNLRPVRKKRFPPGGKAILKVPQPNLLLYRTLAREFIRIFQCSPSLQTRFDSSRNDRSERNCIFLPKMNAGRTSCVKGCATWEVAVSSSDVRLFQTTIARTNRMWPREPRTLAAALLDQNNE